MESSKETIEPQDLSHSKKIAKFSNQSEILKIQSEVRKRKRMIEMEIEFKKNKQQFSRISEEIQEYQKELEIKKRQAINKNMQQIETKKTERQRQNKDSNKVLAKIKEQNRERRRRMESLVHQYKQEYDYVYKKKLSQRKEMINQVNFEEILEHQREYEKSLRKRSQRIKTESEINSKRTQRKLSPSNILFGSPKNQNNKNDDEQIRKQKILDLINRKNEYGNRMQKQAPHVKISMTLLKRIQDEKNKIQYDKQMDYYQKQQRKWRKARLDTNLTGNIQNIKNKQIDIITNEETSTKNKLTKLKHLVDGLHVKYVNGKEEVLDLMCNASLARANLLLHES